MKTSNILNPEVAEVQRLKKLNTVLNKNVKKLLQERGKDLAFVEDLKSVIPPSLPYPDQPLEISEGDSEFAAVVLISDWQIGEVIDAKETDGFGKFNHAAATRRVFTLASKLVNWVDMHRKAGHTVSELHIFSIGDLVSGNIHHELEVTNEFPVTIAVEKAGELLAEFVRKLAPHFPKIVLWELSADNHGRLTVKNQWKQGGKNNYSRLVHTIANARLAAHENVEIVIAEGVSQLCDVQGVKFLNTHGHQIKGQMGIPFYGFLRMKAKEAIRRMSSGKSFDYICIGHFHVPGVLEGILVNGSLPGSTELDHALGRHSPPSQVSFMVNPRKGLIFNWCSWDLS